MWSIRIHPSHICSGALPALRKRARRFGPLALVGWITLFVALVVGAVSVEAIRLARGIHRDASLAKQQRLHSPVGMDGFAGSGIQELLFLQKHLAGVKRFYFVGGGARHFALFFLLPATAVDRIDDAQAVVGVDGADIRGLYAAATPIERYGDVSVQLLPTQ